MEHHISSPTSSTTNPRSIPYEQRVDVWRQRHGVRDDRSSPKESMTRHHTSHCITHMCSASEEINLQDGEGGVQGLLHHGVLRVLTCPSENLNCSLILQTETRLANILTRMFAHVTRSAQNSSSATSQASWWADHQGRRTP